MQKWRDPSFLCTSTTALHHGDWLGWIAPTSSMSLRDVLTSSSKGRGIHLNCSLKGSLSVMWISCSITLMQPSSLSPKAKTSWKARTSSLAAAAFCGVHELMPSRFNFPRSFSCHTVTERGSGCISSPRAPLGTVLLGEQAMQTPHVLSSCPSSNRWGYPTCCLPQQTPRHF